MQRDLVERAIAGDHGAFSELARVSVGRLYVVARLTSPQRSAAGQIGSNCGSSTSTDRISVSSLTGPGPSCSSGETRRDGGEARMDRELVERAMRGDHGAFTELARQQVGRLLVIARLILRDEPDAEDATQAALVAARSSPGGSSRPRTAGSATAGGALWSSSRGARLRQVGTAPASRSSRDVDGPNRLVETTSRGADPGSGEAELARSARSREARSSVLP